ncbi:hypothetical protein WJ978_25465 [Achromobacter xylosoxidans]
MLRLLPRWLLPALAAVLFGGCASSPGPARNPAAAPAGGNDAMSMPAPPPPIWRRRGPFPSRPCRGCFRTA